MNLENMLCEGSQIPKTTYCMIPSMRNIPEEASLQRQKVD